MARPITTFWISVVPSRYCAILAAVKWRASGYSARKPFAPMACMQSAMRLSAARVANFLAWAAARV